MVRERERQREGKEEGEREERWRGERDTTCCHPLYPAITRCYPLLIAVTPYHHPLLPVVTRRHRCHPSSTDVIRRTRRRPLPSNPSP